MEDDVRKMFMGVYLNKERMLELRDPKGEELAQKPAPPPEGDPLFQQTVKLTGYTVTKSTGNRVKIYIDTGQGGPPYCVWVDLVTWEWGYC